MRGACVVRFISLFGLEEDFLFEPKNSNEINQLLKISYVEDGPLELLFSHGGYKAKISDFS